MRMQFPWIPNRLQQVRMYMERRKQAFRVRFYLGERCYRIDRQRLEWLLRPSGHAIPFGQSAAKKRVCWPEETTIAFGKIHTFVCRYKWRRRVWQGLHSRIVRAWWNIVLFYPICLGMIPQAPGGQFGTSLLSKVLSGFFFRRTKRSLTETCLVV